MLASFVGCGALLVALFAVLLGCTAFTAADPTIALQVPPTSNAIACHCTCEGNAGPIDPKPNPIYNGADDAAQAATETTATLDDHTLILGLGNTVGLRFLSGVPRDAKILTAYLQFKAHFSDGPDANTDLTIRVVNAGNVAPFKDATAGPDATDLTKLPILPDVILWQPNAWTAGSEQTTDRAHGLQGAQEDLRDLVQAIVRRTDYTPGSSIAFLITGSGAQRRAYAFEGQGDGKKKGEQDPGEPPKLIVTYTPPPIPQDIWACGDVSTSDSKNAICHNLQLNLDPIANQCKLAKSCTCTIASPEQTKPADACRKPCPDGPDNVFNPNDPTCDIKQVTKATPTSTPTCVTTSPLGSVVFGQRSTCDIKPEQSTVFARAYKGSDSTTASNEPPDETATAPSGRIEFVGRPCPDRPPGADCPIGLTYRVDVSKLTFPSHGGLFDLFLDDVNITGVTGIGESNPNVFASVVNGFGSFGPKSTTSLIRGTKEGGETVAVVNQNTDPLNISIGINPQPCGGAGQPPCSSWAPGALCTMSGWLVKTGGGNEDAGFFEMNVNLKGTLVNQPPTADACPSASRTSADACPDLPKVECNLPGVATFPLIGAASDPDNNITSIGWFRDGSGGPQVAAQLAAEVTQAVKTKTAYTLKIIDSYGQKDEDTATIEVVDTTPPEVTAPADVTAECNPASPGGGTAVDIGKATAADVCDLSPDITHNAPQLFSLGDTKVTWSATDESTNVGTATQTVHIVDTTPPDLSVTLTPAVLWSPNHKLVTITANITATDKCDPNPLVKLISVTSNEPDNGLGDGDQPNDIQSATGGSLVVGDDIRSFRVRSERAGNGTGRVYTVVYEARDHSGNSATQTATVTVPRNQK